MKLIACCAAQKNDKNTPIIDAHLFDTIGQDSLAESLSMAFDRKHIDSIVSANREIVCVDPDTGSVTTMTLPMYVQEHWTGRGRRLMEDSSYTETDKDLKNEQYALLGRLMHGRMELKRPDSAIKLESVGGSKSSIRDQYQQGSHFMQPYIKVQEEWKEKSRDHNKKYREAMLKKCSEKKEPDLDPLFIELKEEIARMLIADPGVIYEAIKETKREIETKITLLDYEISGLKSGKPAKNTMISFESEDFDCFFEADLPSKKQPSNEEKIKEMEMLLLRAKKTLPVLDDLSGNIWNESKEYTEIANKDWQEFKENLLRTEKECTDNYKKNKKIISFIHRIKDSLMEKVQEKTAGNSSFFIELNKNIPKTLYELDVISNSDDEPKEKIQRLQKIVQENKPLLDGFSEELAALAEKPASPSVAPG